MNPAILIPAYNPPKTFPELLKAILKDSNLPVIVVDDGSTPPLENIHHTVLQNKENMGKGFSLIKGFMYALESGYTHVITLDADSQHDPQFIPEFLKIDFEVPLVYGKRTFHKDMPYHRRVSNKLTSSILSYFSGQKISDSQCGFRRYQLDSVLKYEYCETGFQFESEVLIKVGTNNENFASVPISTLYNFESSSINNLFDTLKFIRLIFRSTIDKLRKV